MRYEGDLFGFNYDIELENDEAFKAWLKAKLLKYMFHDPLVNQVFKDIIGIDEINDRLDALENP